MPLPLTFNDETALAIFAKDFAQKIKPGAVVFLEGQLGAGKTTFVRHFLHALGYKGKVKSPTYTVVESYSLEDHIIHHFDWYRLISVAALEDMGIRDYFDGKAICLIEWPNQIPNFISTPDWILSFYHVANHPFARQIMVQTVKTVQHAH